MRLQHEIVDRGMTEYTTKQHKKEERKQLIKTVLLAVLITLFCRFFIFEFANVTGSSMEPTLSSGDTVVVEKVSYLFRDIQVGDIVVCDYNKLKGAYIKRVMGVAGDRVAVQDGKFFLNGKPYMEDVYTLLMAQDMQEIIVPRRKIFVLGDNRNASLDSRHPECGFIPTWAVVGRGFMKVIPLDEISLLS